MTDRDTANFTLSAKSVATASSLAALGLLATLAIVVGVRDVDILSAVALALAILAFVVQLIVYIVQSASAANQLADARTLHGQMMTALAELQERTVGTQKSIDIISQQVVTDLRRKAGGQSAAEIDVNYIRADGPNSAQQGARPPKRTPAASEPARQGTLSYSEAEKVRKYPEALTESVSAAINSELSSWPNPDEISEIQSAVEGMNLQDLNSLRWLVMDSFDFTEPGRAIGPGVPLDPKSDGKRLTEAGLAEKLPGWRLYVPTAKGRRYGRFFTAKGPAPEGTPRKLIELRDQLTPDEDIDTYRENP